MTAESTQPRPPAEQEATMCTAEKIQMTQTTILKLMCSIHKFQWEQKQNWNLGFLDSLIQIFIHKINQTASRTLLMRATRKEENLVLKSHGGNRL